MLSSAGNTHQCPPTSAVLDGLDDELRDASRVLSHGQEEDLRYALDRVLGKVEQLSSLLKTALQTQTELETQLNIAKSNLQLVICNNEMLEEALKRETPGNARDVGWRRWSAREAQNHSAEKKSEDRSRSLDYGPLNESGTPTVPSGAVVDGAKIVSPQPTTQIAGQESRFFRFRFTSGTRSPAVSPHPSHLTSPSLSSLTPNIREKEIEELQEQLEHERQAHKTAAAAKAALEAELESLSQALFEEANNMVATERMKRAETEEELNQTRLEKDALRQALKLVEGENGQLRSANASRASQSDPPTDLRSCPNPSSPQPPTGSPTGDVTASAPPSYKVSGRLTGFVLEPAPKPLLTVLHRKAGSMEKFGVHDLSVSSLKESLPSDVASPPVPLMPDEPSPWAS